MTTQTTGNKKAHADNMGVNSVLGDHAPVTEKVLQDDKLLSKLYHLLENNVLLDIQSEIAPKAGDNTAVYQQTTGTVALPLHNKDYETVSLLCIRPNVTDHSRYHVTDTSKLCAAFLGVPTAGHELVMVDNLVDGVALASHFLCNKATVLVSPTSHLFIDSVKDFAQDATVTIFPDISHKDKISKQLAGYNVKMVIPELPMMAHVEANISYAEILSYPDTQVIELEQSGWGEPEPLASDPSQPTPYPINAFTGLLRRVIELVAYYAQVPLAMAGNCVLGALAHMGQRFIDAPMGHKHMPASLILITEGESGSGKTQVMDLTHFKIDEHERQQYEQYLIDLDIWESDKVGLKGAELKEYLSTTPKPTNSKTVFDDATIEPILDKFVDGEINNASWATDEAAQFFNGHTMKGDTAGNALGAITKLHSSGRAARQRSQKSAHATPRTDAYDVRMTLLLQGQRVILEPALTDPLMNGQGFLARALIACPEDLRGKRVWNDEQRNNDNPHDNPDLMAYWSRCHSLLDPLPANEPTDAQGVLPRLKIQWEDNHTRQVFNDLAQGIENRQANGQGLEYLKAYASRMAENASRIASLMAFFEGRKVITTDDITRAFMLVEYSTSERLRYLDATPTGEQNDSEKLSSWLVDKAKAKQSHRLNRTDIYNGAPKPMRKNNRILQGELDNLESMGHIRQMQDGKKKVIYINPKLFI